MVLSMGKGTKLSPYEQGRIDSLWEEGLSMRAIAHRITHSYKAVNSYLKGSSGYASKNPGGLPPKLLLLLVAGLITLPVQTLASQVQNWPVALEFPH